MGVSMSLSAVINKKSSLLKVEQDLHRELDLGDVVVGMLVTTSEYKLEYPTWSISKLNNQKGVVAQNRIKNIGSMLKEAVFGSQKWSAKYDYELSPIPYRPDRVIYPFSIGKDVYLFRSTIRLCKGTCFAIIVTSNLKRNKIKLLSRLVSGLSQKQASHLINNSLDLSNLALSHSRKQNESRAEKDELIKLIQKSALTQNVVYWSKTAGQSVFKLNFDAVSAGFELTSRDKLVEDLRDDSFRTITRLRSRALTDYMAKSLVNLAKEQNWQSIAVRAISVKGELVGILLCGYSQPIFPREIIKILLNGVDHLLTDLLFSDFSMSESQQQIERLRASQPLIFAGLQSSLKIHDSIPLLGNVILALERLKKEYLGDEIYNDLSKTKDDLDEIHSSLKSAMRIADFDTYSYQEVNVTKLIEQVKDANIKKMNDYGIVFENLVEANLQIIGDMEAYEHVFMNLVQNAIYFLNRDISGEDRIITVSARSSDTEIEIEVNDNGPGVARGMHEKIFEFLVTFKTKGEGTGVGLSVSQLIVEYFGGQIVSKPTSKGARFIVKLPNG